MPSHETHQEIDEILFKKRYPKVHHEKDVYAKYLGPSHRRIAHDPLSNAIIAIFQYPDDPLGAFLSATVHDAVDKLDTSLKRASHTRRRKR